MSISTLLIFSSDPDFAATVMTRWQSPPAAFIPLRDGQASDGVLSACDLALCGQAPLDSLVAILRSLDAAGKTAICLAPDPAAASTLRHAHPRAIIVLQQEGWFDNLVLLAGELLRSIGHERGGETGNTEMHAELGRFMLDMRHRLNNALTSVLGNSELLLLEPDLLAPNVREQIAVMHDMALRIHEVILHFSAL
ncbi:MAG: histidine kinase dimerization/phospho-acceptor domain-containing protein [Terriglobales bacterium]